MAHIAQLDTSTLSNQNISAALLVHTWTNTSRIREVQINVHVDAVLGGGDYQAWITVQRSGAGSAYVSARMANTAPTGVTAMLFQSQWLTVNATDVVKVYVLGLAGDTTTPDIITDVNEKYLDPTTMDLTSAIPDSIPADASMPNVRQALYMLLQWAIEKAVSGTTITVKKPDGSTTLFTLTISDATNPVSITRAT